MASTIWKGQLTFGLVSFPVRLVKAARKERIPLRYVRETKPPYQDGGGQDEAADGDEEESGENHIVPAPSFASGSARSHAPASLASESTAPPAEVVPVQQGYFSDDRQNPISTAELRRGFEVAPQQFVVVQPEELRKLRQATSTAMQILRSVRMEEIDPVFLETSYYVLPGKGGDRSYGLFYRALTETKLAALAQVAMHGREHVMVIRPGLKGLIAHTMFYVNEVRSAEEHAANATDVGEKELDLAKRFVEAIADTFRPEEFTDKYREQLEALIASKEPSAQSTVAGAAKTTPAPADIMDALRKSLETAKAAKALRKPAATAGAPEKKPARKRGA